MAEPNPASRDCAIRTIKRTVRVPGSRRVENIRRERTLSIPYNERTGSVPREYLTHRDRTSTVPRPYLDRTGEYQWFGSLTFQRAILYVCLSAHAILAVRAIKSITKDTIVLSVRFAAILKWRFSLNCLIRKLERPLLTLAGAAIFS